MAPILLIAFNRPRHVLRVLTEIRKQQPANLYVCQDGPREGNANDISKCQEVRDVIKELVDWPCKLHTLYREKNLGCGRGPYEAISWFFQYEEMGIILEDDILPHPLFFNYCTDLLDRYKEDTRIGMIVGHNFYRKYSRNHSYYFTYDTEGTLGWATWKRVWQDFDFNIDYNATSYEQALLNYMYMPPLYRKHLHMYFKDALSISRHDHWDYQWEYYLQIYGYLNIKPNSCLTSHEGNDIDATHQGYDSVNYLMEVNEPLFAILDHPKKVCLDLYERLRVYYRTFKLLKMKMINNVFISHV